MTKKEVLKAIEKNRKHMYKFLDKPVSRQDKRKLANSQQQIDDQYDEFERMIEENKVRITV